MGKRMLVMLVAGAMAAGLVACGGDDDSDEGSGEVVTEQPATQEETGESGGNTGGGIAVAADPGGSLEFEEDSLTAPAGSASFEFTNEASVPHDFDIEDSEGKKVADGEVVTGDSTTVKADLKPGTYTFYCSVANHRESGMEGKLEVE